MTIKDLATALAFFALRHDEYPVFVEVEGKQYPLERLVFAFDTLYGDYPTEYAPIKPNVRALLVGGTGDLTTS